MKAPVGLLSDRTVLRQQDGGARPDKFAFVALCGALQTHFHGKGRNGKRHMLTLAPLREHSRQHENMLLPLRFVAQRLKTGGTQKIL